MKETDDLEALVKHYASKIDGQKAEIDRLRARCADLSHGSVAADGEPARDYNRTIIQKQTAEIERLRKHRLDLRDRVWTLEDENDQLKSIVAKTTDLRGDSFEVLFETSNGQLHARPRARVREEWIRAFAASAAACPEITPLGAVIFAHKLWDELEGRFQSERDSAKVDSTPEGEG